MAMISITVSPEKSTLSGTQVRHTRGLENLIIQTQKHSSQGEMTNPSDPPIIEAGNNIAIGLELPGASCLPSQSQVSTAKILLFDNDESAILIRPAILKAGFGSVSFTNQ